MNTLQYQDDRKHADFDFLTCWPAEAGVDAADADAILLNHS